MDETILDLKSAIKEASRCLNCKIPKCKEGCPIGNEIPSFIHALSKGNIGEAREILAEKTNLPAICGRVCPHELQCEGHCILESKKKGIKIGFLERFIADFAAEMRINKERIKPKTRGKVAVIGSGPAGLTVAGDLARKGFMVTVFDALPEMGGILLFGIPDFRLPKDVVRREIGQIEQLGVVFEPNHTAGKDFTVDDLFQKGFDAVFIGSGTAIARELNLEGKEYKGVIQSAYFLRMIALYKAKLVKKEEILVSEKDRVLVIGGGNVAMDAARSAKRMGADSVTVIYRGKPETMSALQSEYQAAKEEGVQFCFEHTPIRYVGNKNGIEGLYVAVPEGEKLIHADKILLAIGSRPANRIVSTTTGIEVDSGGYVVTKEKPYGMTTRKGVFAGGDVVHKPATVVLAMKDAKKVAEGIERYVDAVKLLEL